MSVAPLLTNNLDNSKQKTSNLLSPASPPYSWSLLGKCEGPAPPPSSKISRSFDLAWNPVIVDSHTAPELWYPHEPHLRPVSRRPSYPLPHVLNHGPALLSPIWWRGVNSAVRHNRFTRCSSQHYLTFLHTLKSHRCIHPRGWEEVGERHSSARQWCWVNRFTRRAWGRHYQAPNYVSTKRGAPRDC